MATTPSPATVGLAQLLLDSDWAPLDPARTVLPYIQQGADVNYYLVPQVYRCILHECIRRGSIDVLDVIFTHVVGPLDFTVPDRDTRHVFTIGGRGYEFASPLLFLCEYEHCSHDRVAAVMQRIVHRLETHPNDIMKWDQKSREGRDFVSSAAFYQRLSLFWPLIKHLPYFADATTPFPLSSRVWAWDWEMLGAEEQKNFTIEKPDLLLSVPKPTAELLQLCFESTPCVQQVTACIAAGGDPCFQLPSGMYQSVLQEFISGGQFDCVAACLTSPAPLDFTKVDGAKRTVLHLLCEYKNLTAEKARDILRLLVRRRREGDKIDWSMQDGWGHGFISRAAYYQRLSLFYPVLVEEKVEYFTSAAAMPLGPKVWAWDWEALGASRSAFTLTHPLIEVDPPATAHLFRLCAEAKWHPDPARVRELVQQGGNIGYAQDSDMEISLLHELVKRGDVKAVEAALCTDPLPPRTSPLPIDFTRGKIDSMTGNAVAGICRESLLLVYLNDYAIVPDALAMLKAIVHRLQRHPGVDALNWAQKIYDGRDFISAAAEAGRLSVFWPVVSSLPYFEAFATRGEKIPVQKPAEKTDWETLSPAVQERFQLNKGFREERR